MVLKTGVATTLGFSFMWANRNARLLFPTDLLPTTTKFIQRTARREIFAGTGVKSTMAEEITGAAVLMTPLAIRTIKFRYKRST